MSVLTRRRTYLKADARKEQLLAVAKDVFATRGVRDASVADICEAAKIGRGTLYQYFDNKDHVLRAVMDGIADRIADAVGKRTKVSAIPGIEDAPVAMVLSFCAHRVRQILDVVFADEATLRLVLRETRGQGGAVEAALVRIDAAMLGAMEGDMRAAQAAGILRADLDATLAARFVLGGMEKVVLAALAGDAPIDLDAIVRATVEIQMFGMLTRKPTEKEGAR
jgi:AcrR family transcriptional regulator